MSSSKKLIDAVSGGAHVRQPRATLSYFDSLPGSEPPVKEVRMYAETVAAAWRDKVSAVASGDNQEAVLAECAREVAAALNKPRLDNDLKAVLVVAHLQPAEFGHALALAVLTSPLYFPTNAVQGASWLGPLFRVLLNRGTLVAAIEHFRRVAVSDESPDNPTRRGLRQFMRNILVGISGFVASEERRALRMELAETLMSLAETRVFRDAIYDRDLVELVNCSVLDRHTLQSVFMAMPSIGLHSGRCSTEAVAGILTAISGKVNLFDVDFLFDWPPSDTHAYLLRLLNEADARLAFPVRLVLACRVPGQSERVVALLKTSDAGKCGASALVNKLLLQTGDLAREIFSQFQETVEFYEHASAGYARWTRKHFRAVAAGLETSDAERWLRVLHGVVSRRPQAMALVWEICLDKLRKIYQNTDNYLDDATLETVLLELLAWRGAATPSDLRLALRELLGRGRGEYERWMGGYFRPLLDLVQSEGVRSLSGELMEICVGNFAHLPTEGHEFLLALMRLTKTKQPKGMLAEIAKIAARRRLTAGEWTLALETSDVTQVASMALAELEAGLADNDLEISSLRVAEHVLALNADVGDRKLLTAKLLDLLQGETEGFSDPVVECLCRIAQHLGERSRTQEFSDRLAKVLDRHSGLLVVRATASAAPGPVIEEIFEAVYENAMDTEVLGRVSEFICQITEKFWTSPQFEATKMLLGERIMEPIETPFRPRVLLELVRRGSRHLWSVLLESACMHASEISVLASRSRRDAFEVETVEKVIAEIATLRPITEDLVTDDLLLFVATAMFVTKVPDSLVLQVFVSFSKIRQAQRRKPELHSADVIEILDYHLFVNKNAKRAKRETCLLGTPTPQANHLHS